MPVEQPTFSAEELAIEIWKDVVGYEGHYEVSDLGRVKSLKTYHGRKPGKILRLSLTKNKLYFKVTFSVASKLSSPAIADLVAAAFIGPKPAKYEVNHIDGVKRNNRANNVEYLTKKGNMEHAARTGLMAKGERHGSKTHPERVARGDKCGFRTHPEIIQRGDDHWTRRFPGSQVGAKNPSAKTTTEQRIAIRVEYANGGISMRRLGQKHGLCAQAVCDIVHSKS